MLNQMAGKINHTKQGAGVKLHPLRIYFGF